MLQLAFSGIPGQCGRGGKIARSLVGHNDNTNKLSNREWIDEKELKMTAKSNFGFEQEESKQAEYDDAKVAREDMQMF